MEALEPEDQGIEMVIYANDDVAQGVRKTEWRKEKETLSLISNMLQDIKK